jgi:hypothetical protein
MPAAIADASQSLIVSAWHLRPEVLGPDVADEITSSVGD